MADNAASAAVLCGELAAVDGAMGCHDRCAIDEPPTKRGDATGVSYRRLRASACLVAGSVVTCSEYRRMRPTGEARDGAAAHRGGKGLGLALGRGEWHRSDGCAQRTKLGTNKRYDGMHICAQANKQTNDILAHTGFTVNLPAQR